MAQYGLQVKDVNRVVRSAFAGERAGTIYEGEKRFALVVRLDEKYRQSTADVKNLYIPLQDGTQVPLQAVADVKLTDAPMQISRENTNRRIVIGVNVGDTDVETLVSKIQSELDAKVKLPAGYYFTYGGQFENLKAANARLAVAVPLALSLIFILLYFTFGSMSQAALIFTAIPLSAIGGIWALELRGMPFSISAGIGFIALFGVAVLNGIVLIGYFNELKKEGITDIRERIIKGTRVRLRPVLMTAAVASLGFLPMALSNSGGAEVQRPLATVVIGGLLTATFLTLVVLPVLYSWLEHWKARRNKSFLPKAGALLLLPFLFFGIAAQAQQRSLSMEEAVQTALNNSPGVRAAELQVQQGQALQNLPYSLGTTEVYYQGDGLFRENGQRVNQVSAVQNIPHPAGIRAQNNLQKEKTAQSLLQRQMTEAELQLQVKQTYIDLQQHKALLQLYERTVAIYDRYYQTAKVRAEAGEGGKIDVLTLQSARDEYRLLVRQTALKISGSERQLAMLLNSDEAVTTADSLRVLPFVPEATPEPVNSLRVLAAQQDIQIERANTELLQAQTKPDFNVGYAVQNYFESGWLHGLQAGVQVPLFRKQIKQKIAAQELQTEVARANLEVQRVRSDRDLLTVQNQIQLYEAGIEYYREQAEIINPEAERIARLNYRAGEISYLELLNTLNLATKNKRAYTEQTAARNQAVVLYRFLSNQ